MPKILKESVKSNFDRSEQAGREKCDRSDKTFSKPVCQSYLSSVKERWDQQTGHKSQTAKQTRQVHAFQNGRDSESGRSLTMRRSHVQVRPQRHLLCNPSGSSVSGISKVSLERSPLQIQSSPLWSRLGSTYLLKIDETFRNQMCNLSWRSYSPTSGTSGVTKPATDDNLSVAKPGVHHQLGKICDKCNTANRVSGLSHRFILNDNVTTHAKIKRPSKSMSKAVQERADISQTVGQNHRENVRSIEGHPSGSSTIQASTTLENLKSYESLIQIKPECKAELQWWIESVPQWNGRSVIRPSPDLSINITTDASRRGWGAHCAGVKTQGLWTPEEQKLHINALEIKAVMFAVKAFTKNKSQVNVHHRVDNTTTMSYINKMGGIKSMDMINISKALWDYCLSKQITLTAEILPGIQNQIADAQSRNYQDSSNWKLNKSIF